MAMPFDMIKSRHPVKCLKKSRNQINDKFLHFINQKVKNLHFFRIIVKELNF